MTRTAVVWCPDWPLVSAGTIASPSAVLRANRVVASSPAARQEGVRLGQRRREAEAACPGLLFVEDDPPGELRSFEKVLRAVTSFTPSVELTRPGVCCLPVRGPARYFGGEEALSSKMAAVATRAATELGGKETPPAKVGIADTPFAARLAARSAAIVAPGKTAEWLSPLPVGALGLPALAELLERMGLFRIGQFAALDEALVSGRFGREGLLAHRLARGEDDHRLEIGELSPELSVQKELEDPLESAEQVAFVAAGLAEELLSELSAAGLCCTRLFVEAATEHAEELARWWCSDTPFTSRSMVDRVRWQLEGWLTSPGAAPSAGITLVRLSAGEVGPDLGRQLDLLSARVEAGPRLERAVARVQGLLGPESVLTGALCGGRGPLEQACLVPWRQTSGPSKKDEPWPGRLPSPSPAVVYPEPPEVELAGKEGGPVRVSGRGKLASPPCSLAPRGGRPLSVTAWAGPWPLEERWWDPSSHRRRARLQVMLEDGSSHLLSLEKGSWRLEASYD
jgi:protein ImuB